ncbi:hypothetical protein [Paenibacillus lignilyticus]|uniref:DUF3892 domain-containing protein n=1 Tax=Paenibacillus lignilyticus TaxID=1172615 RepID=A0ABS5CGV1_9BACL|nr:hypothetical protein [Paenibacillus lignilyticus]MBP3965056.1 hypothetical protein [Paenibacillus lignilyticus]
MARFLIKHAVGGRTFVDSDANPQIQYELKAQDKGGSLITAHLPAEMAKEMAELLKWKQELNVFIFDDLDDGRQQKTWFYTGDGDVHYNKAERILRIRSSHDIHYLPSNYPE